MRLEQLEVFVATARCGSISAAARKLGISRPAASAAVKSLEQELDVALLLKGNQGVHLTPAGQLVLEKAAGALALIDEMRNYGRADIKNSVSICSTPLLSLYLTRNIFLPFKERHPHFDIVISNTYLTDVVRQLETRASCMAVTLTSLGLNIVESAKKLGCEIIPLYTDERKLFMGARHPLAAREYLTAEDLSRLNIALYSTDQEQVSRRYLPYFAGSYRVSNRSDMLDLVVRNEAVFIHPAIQCRHDLRVIKGDVVEKRLRLDSIKHEVPVVAIRLPELTVAERLFWQYLIVNFAKKL